MALRPAGRHNYTESGGEPYPYQVRLNSGVLVCASPDTDDVIRKQAECTANTEHCSGGSEEQDTSSGDATASSELSDGELIAQRMFDRLQFLRGRIVIPNKLEFVKHLISRIECTQSKDERHGYGQVLSCLGGCLRTGLNNMLRDMVENERTWCMAQHVLAKTIIEAVMIKVASNRSDEVMQQLLAEEAAGTAMADKERKQAKDKKKKQKQKQKRVAILSPPSSPLQPPPKPPAFGSVNKQRQKQKQKQKVKGECVKFIPCSLLLTEDSDEDQDDKKVQNEEVGWLSKAEIAAFKKKYAKTLAKEKAERLARLQEVCTQEWASYTCRCGAPGCEANISTGGRAG
jgi:hypothetical protein